MTNNTIEIIENLIQTCRNGEEGYRSAAEHTNDLDLRDFFDREAKERARFARELERVAQGLGEPEPSRDTSVASKLHRAWFDLKQKFGGGDESVVASVETGESDARKEYQEALDSDLPFDVRAVVERQFESIAIAYDRVCALRDQFKRAA